MALQRFHHYASCLLPVEFGGDLALGAARQATLVHRLIDVIGRDQLVLAVLDDISEPHRDAGDHKFKEVA